MSVNPQVPTVGSVNVAVNAVRFLYGITLGRNTEALSASVPHMKHPIRRAEAAASALPRHQMLTYLTCKGLSAQIS